MGILVLLVGLLAYDTFYAATSRYTVRYETLSSVRIPDQMDNVTIAYFSDLEYGLFMDETRLSKLAKKIQSLDPDIIIFGGDLVAENLSSVSDTSALTAALSSFEAPLGKFAVLGDNDAQNETVQSQVEQILYDSDFEVLNNRSILLRNEGSGSITLTGLNCNSLDTSSAFASVSKTTYNIVVCHTPDSADSVPSDLTSYFLAGHSHGGEIYWGFGAEYMPSGCNQYFRGKHDLGTFTLDITNGVSTSQKDARFMADAEVVLYRLEHVSIR